MNRLRLRPTIFLSLLVMAVSLLAVPMMSAAQQVDQQSSVAKKTRAVGTVKSRLHSARKKLAEKLR